jgi:multidrug efflux pump subunit AcrB
VLDSEQMKSLQQQLPAGFVIEPGGAFEESLDSRVQMLTSFAMSFFLIVLCLVFQYNGWSKPLIVLATLPLALIGALPGLYVTGNSIGFMPQLGILSLFGIVLNTGIIFIEFADLLIKERIERGAVGGPIMGLTRDEFRECLVAAGKQRMLPIFLTTATTVGGLIQLALSGGPLWEGLAWCMIFGLIVATLLTLFVIPALYAIFVETFGVQPLAATEQPPVPVEQ